MQSPSLGRTLRLRFSAWPWKRIGDILYWGVLVVVLVVLVRRVHPSIPLAEATGAAPAVVASALDGTPFPLADLRGQVVVLNFWATWCPPCRAEMPGFVRLSDAFRDDGVVFVGVALDEEGAEAVAPYVQQHDIPYPVVLADAAFVAAFGGVAAVPTTLLIDRRGQIRYRHEGFLMASALKPALQALAREH